MGWYWSVYTYRIVCDNANYNLITRQMKSMALGLILGLLTVAITQPACLLEDPLTDGCIQSVDAPGIDATLAEYLCTIAYERKIYAKAEQFCKVAMHSSEEHGYNYLNALLANGKLISALKTDYTLFFVQPFDHNARLTEGVEKMGGLLTALEGNGEEMGKLNDFEKAILYFYLKETQKSLQHLGSHIKQLNQTDDATFEHLLMLRILQKQFKYYQALEYVNKLTKEQKRLHPYLYHLKGNLLMHHVHFRKAIPEFQRANAEFQRLFGSNSFSLTNYNLGLCHEKLGEQEQAIKHYEKSILNLPSAEAFNALAHAHHASFQNSKNKKALEIAENYYRKALHAKPEYSIAVFNLGMLQLEKGEWAAAIGNFQGCASSIRSCKYGLIKAYYGSNSSALALPIIDSLQRNEETVAELAAILYQMEDSPLALRIIGDGDYKSSQLYQWKGFNQYALEQYESAEASFLRAIFLGSKQAATYYSLGLSQLHLKKYAECAQSFERAHKLDPREDTKQQWKACRKLQGTDL